MTYQYEDSCKYPEEVLKVPYESGIGLSDEQKRNRFMAWLEIYKNFKSIPGDPSKVDLDDLDDIEIALYCLEKDRDRRIGEKRNRIRQKQFEEILQQSENSYGGYSRYSGMDDDIRPSDDYIEYNSKYSNPDMDGYIDYEDAIDDCERQINMLESRRRRLIQAMSDEEEREREEENIWEEKKRKEEQEADEEEQEEQDFLDGLDRYMEEHGYD